MSAQFPPQVPVASPAAAAAAVAHQQAAQQAAAQQAQVQAQVQAQQQAAASAQQASTAPVGGVAPAFLAGMPPSMMVPPPGAAPGAAPGTPGAFPPPGAAFPFMAGLPFPGSFPGAMAFNPAMLGGYRFPPMPPGSPMEKAFFAQMMQATLAAQNAMKKKAAVQQNSQANIKKLGTLGKKLAAAVAGGKDIELDKQLTAIARQKQMHSVPMTPDVRLHAYLKRESVRPEPKMTCPKGHKVTATVAKKALTHNDVYLCNSPEGCGLPCGGNDSHPLHLNVKFLNPQDKHNYLDSCRWLSKNEVENQTKEYIKGHPLVYPHLAAGVLFNDETDAWRGYVLGWNIYFWFMDIERYWASMRRELEEASGAMDTPDVEGETGEERGRGKRKKRKLVGEVASEAQAALEEAEDQAALQAAIEASTDGAAGAEVGDKRKQPEPAQGSAPAAAASS